MPRSCTALALSTCTKLAAQRLLSPTGPSTALYMLITPLQLIPRRSRFQSIECFQSLGTGDLAAAHAFAHRRLLFYHPIPTALGSLRHVLIYIDAAGPSFFLLTDVLSRLPYRNITHSVRLAQRYQCKLHCPSAKRKPALSLISALSPDLRRSD